MSRNERRHAPRMSLNIPTLVEVIGQRDNKLHPALAAVYERVAPNPEKLGLKFPAVIRDLSTNGCFVVGEALPLLSRVAFTFPLDGYGQVEVLAWTLWRRHSDCEIPRESLPPVKLGAGFGVLFEAIPLAARAAITEMMANRDAATR
jgi:hypothetical protein